MLPYRKFHTGAPEGHRSAPYQQRPCQCRPGAARRRVAWL